MTARVPARAPTPFRRVSFIEPVDLSPSRPRHTHVCVRSQHFFPLTLLSRRVGSLSRPEKVKCWLRSLEQYFAASSRHFESPLRVATSSRHIESPLRVATSSRHFESLLLDVTASSAFSAISTACSRASNIGGGGANVHGNADLPFRPEEAEPPYNFVHFLTVRTNRNSQARYICISKILRDFERVRPLLNS
jgi:hypothetical protein